MFLNFFKNADVSKCTKIVCDKSPIKNTQNPKATINSSRNVTAKLTEHVINKNVINKLNKKLPFVF